MKIRQAMKFRIIKQNSKQKGTGEQSPCLTKLSESQAAVAMM